MFSGVTLLDLYLLLNNYLKKDCIIFKYEDNIFQNVVEQELPTLPEHMNSSPFLVKFVLIDLQFYCRSLFVLLYFFGHCVVCPSSIYRFRLPFMYLQTHLDISFPFIFLHNSLKKNKINGIQIWCKIAISIRGLQYSVQWKTDSIV